MEGKWPCSPAPLAPGRGWCPREVCEPTQYPPHALHPLPQESLEASRHVQGTSSLLEANVGTVRHHSYSDTTLSIPPDTAQTLQDSGLQAGSVSRKTASITCAADYPRGMGQDAGRRSSPAVSCSQRTRSPQIGALVCWSCYSKTPQTFISHHSGGEKSKVGVQPVGVRAPFRVEDFSLCPHRAEGSWELCGASFIRTLMTDPIMRAPPL